MITPEELAAVIADAIATATRPFHDRISGLERRIHADEQQIKELQQREYQGVWSNERRYAKGAMVSRSGSVWHSNVDDNRSTPGQDPQKWTLTVKAGRDLR
jgi:hypothetical protein